LHAAMQRAVLICPVRRALGPDDHNALTHALWSTLLEAGERVGPTSWTMKRWPMRQSFRGPNCHPNAALKFARAPLLQALSVYSHLCVQAYTCAA
jgi:hypothetical protein